MADKIGPRIELEGEREFRRAIAEINNGLKVTGSELKMVTAQYSENAKSVAGLTAKNEVLERQIINQTEKVEKLREVLTMSAQQYGESDARTMKWQESLNTATAELYNLQNQLSKNSEELVKAKENMVKYGLAEDEVHEKTKGIGGVISDLAGKLGINLPAGADKAIKALDGAKLSTAALLGAVTGLITGLAKTTIETAKAADEIMTLSKVTGLSTGTIQEMNYASELLDVSTDTITSSMTKMIRTMDDARKGTGDAAAAYRKLHVSVKDSNGQLKDSEQVFYEAIDALGRVRNETERDALAMEIFGKSAKDLNPLIQAGSKELKKLGEEAKQMGYVMDGDALNSLGQLDDAMQKFKNQTDAFKNSIAMVMLPVLTALFEMLNKIDPKVIAVVAVIGTLAAVAVTVAKAIKGVTDTVKAFKPVADAASAVTGAVNYKAMQTTMIVLGVVAALIALAAIIAVIIGRGGELKSTMAGIGESVGQVQGSVNNAQYGYRPPNIQYVGRNASGTSNWRGGLTWVGEEGPELIDLPKGTRVFSNPDSRRIAQQAGRDTINLYVDMSKVDEVYKLVDVVKRAKQTIRAGTVRG